MNVLAERLQQIVSEILPLPAAGRTAARHRRLFEVAREDLTLAKLAEAHWDAIAILAEAGRKPVPNSLYAVWASEIPGRALQLSPEADGYTISGQKAFCSGVGLVDRALMTTGGTDPLLLDLDLRANSDRWDADLTTWQVDAFRDTQTGGLTLNAATLSADSIIGKPGWYIKRPGFWHGACGPAACWAGGVAGLLDAAMANKRDDPHTLAHLGAMYADVWALQSLLTQAAHEMDGEPNDISAAQIRALALRHTVEQLATDVLRRFARAYGPQPLAMNQPIARRYAEADLYLRQAHGERDLHALAQLIR
ncbi:acyl-CoA/acyl-ACP dehydrogenase [Granulicella sibirica]|uniref:Acyl-CoA dehydrogenase/oxidase domain protein n=1 Tax=Granulicella sibirica TaxID=2479048 RepID=A0A4Q0STJ0_9BACT|nr:acyl-CoA/acyl-ACP dehydrogenase [Granulicella sibirica]RXH53997.1 Acyl-CoA dehydrogenase/oxidase domain protein [Granulicella sibirica]